MTLHSPSSCFSFKPTIPKTPLTKPRTFTLKTTNTVPSSPPTTTYKTPKELNKSRQDFVMENTRIRYCSCCCPRRCFLGSLLSTGFLLISPSFASENDSSPPDDPMAMLNKIHPPRSDWYEELYAWVMAKATKSYEAEIAGYKSQLFAILRGKADTILEIGIGTGPNLKYYADYPGISVLGVDPNMKMEKYARAAAESVGIQPSNFKFMPGVGEALPLEDASVDAVIGTLVLCSVKDVDRTLQEVRRVLKPGGMYLFVEHVGAKDGTIRRFVQRILDPLQQTLADGCHLTRNTENNITNAGFASLVINQAVLSTASFINPHVYGIAYR